MQIIMRYIKSQLLLLLHVPPKHGRFSVKGEASTSI